MCLVMYTYGYSISVLMYLVTCICIHTLTHMRIRLEDREETNYTTRKYSQRIK